MTRKSSMGHIQRRVFVQRCVGLSTASLFCYPKCLDAAEVNQPKRMTLGFGTYGMQSLKTEQAIEAIAEIGFDSIEITVRSQWDASPEKMTMERRKNIRKLLQEKRLRLTSLMEHLPLKNDQASHQQHLNRLQHVADLAHSLSPNNPPLIQTVLGGGKWERVKDWYLKQLADWLKLAEKNKVIIAIKPHRGGAMSRPAEAIWLLDRLGGSPWCKLVYDFSHYAFRGMTMEDTVHSALPHMAHVAVKDAIQENGKIRFALPGESGGFDYPHLLKLLKQGGYRGDINCEVSSMVFKQKNYDAIKSAKKCYLNMSQAFSKAKINRPE